MKTLLFITLLFPHLLFAISEKEVVESSLTHFPKVLQSLQQVEETSGKLVESQGVFDGKIKAEMDTRTEGYYNGDFYKATIEKPFPLMNSKIYGGHRQSFGQFPLYEGKYETQSDGEVFAGLSLSLLRNSFIDPSRYSIAYNKRELEQVKLNLKLTQIDVQALSLKAYWTWVVKGYELRVYQNLLSLAKTRAKQIGKRIKAGDLAKIYSSENNQYILKREAQIIQSQLEFQEASYYLSLFYRDKNGHPQSLSQKMLPPLHKLNLSQILDFNEVYNHALKVNLNLQIISSQIKQAELEVRLGKNALLPKVDVSFEWNQDQGVGPSRLAQDENRILLNIEVPLEFKKGLGKRQVGRAKLEQLKTKSRWIEEKLKVYVQSLLLKLNSTTEIYSLTSEQINLANKLVDAERRKFNQGDSDLVLVNIREESLAEAQIKNLSSLLKYHFVNTDIKSVKAELLIQ